MIQTNQKKLPCYDCTHSSVCKYKDSFEEIWNKHNSTNDIHDVAIVTISCKHFCGILNNAIYREYGDLSQLSVDAQKRKCEDCDFFKNHLATGKTYIGDSPCQWCSNYPYQITCQASTASTSVQNKSKTILNETIGYNTSVDKEISKNV